MNIDQQVADLGVRLADASIRNTMRAIINRIGTAKTKRDEKETILELEEIISDLVADKNELVRIAQSYEQEFVAQQISKEDIEYITTKFIPVLKDLIQQTSNNETGDKAAHMEKAIDSLTPLLSVEMITVLQLVGFNFKKAVGEPLTMLLQKLITSQIPVDQQSTLEHNKLALTCSTQLLKVAQGKDASERLEQLRAKGIV